MSAERPYSPIDCSLHDRLESAATLRKPVRIAYRDSLNDLVCLEDRIVDVFGRGGIEFMKLENGTVVRLDDVASVDGVAFSPGKA
jgi:Rho-binding antiterminator